MSSSAPSPAAPQAGKPTPAARLHPSPVPPFCPQRPFPASTL
jgi:hypothetical protein